MQVDRILTLAGPNLWSRRPMLEVWLTPRFGDSEPDATVREVSARLRGWSGSGACESFTAESGRAEFVKSMENASSPTEQFARLALELQRRAGMAVDQVFTGSGETPPNCHIAVEFAEEPVAQLAVRWAERLVWPVGAAIPDDSECTRQLRDCARQACFGATTGPVVAAARIRNIPVTRLDGDCLLQLGHGARQRRIQGVITGETGYLAESISRDKLLTKWLMRQIGLPTAPGRLACDADDAWTAACEIGLPVVVKPRDADYGNGVSVHLVTKEQVVAGWNAARQFRSDVLVERHLPGVPHRLLVVNDALVAAVRRDPAHVVGDGRRTLRELVAEANCDPRRGEGPDFPWYPIAVDHKLLQTLERQGFHLASVPAAGGLVTLQYDPKTCYAEMIRDVTDLVHADVAAIARDAVHVTGLDVAGVDIMAVDIAKPLAEQGGGVLEVNAGPAIYLHQRPMCDPPRPVPEAVVRWLMPAHETGRIPIVAVIGAESAPSAAASVARRLETSGRVVGLSSAAGIRVDGRSVSCDRSDNFAGSRALLLHPRVETAVCELSEASIRDSGLPFDECRVALVTGAVDGACRSGDEHISQRLLRLLAETVPADGVMVINVDALELPSCFEAGDARLLAVAERPNQPFVNRHRLSGGRCAFVEQGAAVIARGSEIMLREPLGNGVLSGTESALAALLAFACAWCVELEAAGQPQRPVHARAAKISQRVICASAD